MGDFAKLSKLEQTEATVQEIAKNLSLEQILASISSLIEKVAGPEVTYAVLMELNGKCAIGSNMKGKKELLAALQGTMEAVKQADEPQIFKTIGGVMDGSEIPVNMSDQTTISAPQQWLDWLAESKNT
jgi:hypothetical protein